MTGLQRKDIKGLRVRREEAAPHGAGPLPRVVAAWQAAGGGVLDRAGFEEIVRGVSQDIHPRTVLDELRRLEMIEAQDGAIRLVTEAFVPRRDEAALMGYLGNNLGDHAAAAVANAEAMPEPGPFFERAVHYNGLSPAALDELEQLSRRLHGEALATINARAKALQDRDRGRGGATGRFRCGAFVYREDPCD